ncbi:MAG: proline--tRNA ligase [candidate division WOR-3 bacterium]
MKWSKAFIYTLKETPSEAETTSHRLLLRGGFIQQIASGVYAFLPLGWRVIRKIYRIIQEEMDRIGGQEIFMPSLNPASLWEESGRWAAFGDDMFRLKDRKGRDYALAPTHEEVISEIARKHIKSHRDLPQIWYQVQNKFRDEPRPRGGLLRVREFLMKDSYTLDATWEGLDHAYELHRQAYRTIFSRCGLPFVEVLASSGVMGGTGSEEFMVLTESGEDTLALCESCRYSANLDVATGNPVPERPQSPYQRQEKVHTPGVRTAEEVARFLRVDTSLIIKTLVYYVGDKPYVILIRGDQELSDAKLAKELGGTPLLALPEEVREIFGADIGFVGPMGIKGRVGGVIADKSVATVEMGVVGANDNDHHIVGVTPGSDFRVDRFADLRVVKDGDTCSCGATLRLRTAVEVGHIFKLGTRYSESMGVTFADADGSLKPVIMGSYGIGLGRIMTAAAEALSDERGLCWPRSISPFEVAVLNIGGNKFIRKAEKLYNMLIQAGLDVILDDRDETPGFKFRDAELIGFPLIVVLGERKMKEGKVEVQVRRTGERFDFDLDEAVEGIRGLLERIP